MTNSYFLVTSVTGIRNYWPASFNELSPEAAIPALPFEVSDYLYELNETAVARGIQMFVGILTFDVEQGGYRNTLWAIGEEEGMYHKVLR